MSIEQNKHLVQHAFTRLFNHGELALADDLVSADFLNHEAPPNAPRGPAGLRSMVMMLRTAFPDLHYDTEEVIAEGDKVVDRTTLRGTHLGPFMGIPPTGRPFVQAQIHILRFVDGKAVEHRAVRDDLGMLQQLGVIPARNEAEA
ncbi:MAG: ester cyclase [Pseudomonadota bacterium]|nr:ester cyclase [Chloroflexota bacterium]MDP9414672.1 ester cyclase [Pseudomonadota bacterium]